MPLHVSVVSPERIVFEGDVESVRAPAFDGEVEGGVLQVVDNQVRVITEHASEA